MINRILFIIPISFILFFSLIFIPSCAKMEEAPESADKSASIDGTRGGENEYPSDIEKASQEEGKKEESRSRDKGGLDSFFMAHMEEAGERLLEYRVNLAYESRDFLKSRRVLLEIISKYGFIMSSTSAMDDEAPSLRAELHVRSASLYEMLKELDRMGTLLSENISVTDHTESMVMNQRKLIRERIRITRKNSALGSISAGNKGWQQREDSLERSENNMDNSEQEKWKINDAVKWAKVFISLKGPDMPGRITVPLYQNALIGLVNFLLNLVYVLIWLLPFIAVFILFWWKRGSLFSLFRRKKDQ